MNKDTSAKIDRRSFLKVSAGFAAASGMLMPSMAQAFTEGSLATIIDLSLCDGCPGKETPACVSACKAIHGKKIPDPKEPIPIPFPSKKVEDWSKKKDVFDRLTPYNYIFVQKADVTLDGQKKTVFVPRRCMHCDNPACATICPFAANHKQKNGAVVIDPDLCFGGAKCKTVCPWEIPQRQSGVGLYLHVLPTLMGNGVMFKCDLCHERLQAGKVPGCVEACPRQALLIGNRKDIYKEAEARAKRMNGHLYGKVENGGTATLYVSPVPFEDLQKAVSTGSGRPDLSPVKRRMAETDGIGKAVMISPFIGMAAALAGAFRWMSARKSKAAKEGQNNDR